MVHRDVPDHHGVHHPFRLEGALFLHTAPCLYRPAGAPVGTLRGAGRPGRRALLWSLVPRRWGSRRACGWRQPVPREGGAWSGGRPYCAGLARGRERRVPANAVIMRPAVGFEIPKDAAAL